MLISKVTQTGFCGKIIDVHVHTGHWDKQCDGKPNGAEPYLVNDIFERADVVKRDGDTISKVIISNLDCIKEENGKPLMDELEGNKKLLADCKGNPRTAVLAVCQPKTGNVKNIETLFDRYPKGFVGLKFHPLTSGLDASDVKYVPYLKFAQKKNLPCLFHSQVNVDNNNGQLLNDNISVADPVKIYQSAKKAPKAPVILGHMGAGWGQAHSKAVDILVESIEKGDANLYADISWVDFKDPEKPNVISAIKRLMNTKKGDKTDRLLFGTDAPIAEYSADKDLYARVVRETKAAIRKNFGDKADELIEKIFYKNADNLFFAQKPVLKLKTGAVILGGLVVLGGVLWALKDKLSPVETKKG